MSLRSEKLAGKSFVVSGVFSRSRDEIKNMIESNGGKNTGSVSGKTSYLVAGDNMEPEKRTKAEKLGVPIISEDDLIKLIEESMAFFDAIRKKLALHQNQTGCRTVRRVINRSSISTM